MINLKSELQKIRRTYIGGVLVEKASSRLEALRSRMFKIFVTLFALCLIAVIIGLVGVAFYVREPTHVAAVGSAMGITVGGLLEMMRRTTKEWSRLDLILILIDSASEQQVRSLLDALIAKLPE
jgi:hypothetical protein